MRTHVILCACIVSIGLANVVAANDKAPRRGKHSDIIAPKAVRPAPTKVAATSSAKEPWIGVDVRIGAPERVIIQEHTRATVHQTPGKKAKGLPPGLAKKVARGGTLPPGWQKKCIRGEILPPEVYEHCHPLPPEVVVKLPTPPPGTILVTVHGKVLRLAKATREILDVFDVL